MIHSPLSCRKRHRIATIQRQWCSNTRWFCRGVTQTWTRSWIRVRGGDNVHSFTECDLCNPGYCNDGSSNYCLACPSGSYSSVGAAACSFSCPAGSGVESGTSSQSTSTETCGTCNPAYANNGATIYCQACAVVTGSSTGASFCSSTCTAGNGVEYGSSSQSTSSEICGYCRQ